LAHDPHNRDPSIAVGRTQIVALEHDFIKVLTKCGIQLYSNSIDGSTGLWSMATLGSLVDPEAEYDASTGRFFLMGQTSNKIPEKLYIAYSAIENATSWTTHEFIVPQMTEGLDSCNLSVDDQHVWVNGISAGVNGIASEPIMCLRKSDLLGSPNPTLFFSDSVSQGVASAHSNVVDNMSYDTTPQYVIQSVASVIPGQSKVKIYTLNLDINGNILFSQPFVLSVPDFQFAVGPIAQPSGGIFFGPVVFTGDSSRIWSAVYRNGSIWACHMIKAPTGPTRILTRWYEISMNAWEGPNSTPSPVLRQAGTIDPGGDLSTLMPSIAVDASNNAAVLYNVVGASQFISINRSSRCAEEPLHQMYTNTQLYISQSSLGSAGSIDGWIDYSDVQCDPAIPNRFYGHTGAIKNPTIKNSWVCRFDGQCGLDYSQNGLIDSADTLLFFDAFVNNQPEADLNVSTYADGDDLILQQLLSKPQ
jgi:hypothetical protein